MFTIVSIVLLAACYILFEFNERPNDHETETVRLRFAVRILLMGAAVAVFTSFVVNAHIPSRAIKAGSWKIALTPTADGRLYGVWGYGTANGAIIYTVYVKNPDGSLSARRLNSDDNVRIKEDSSLRGEGVWTQTYVVRDESSWLVHWTFATNGVRGVVNELTVPVGAFAQSYPIEQ